MKKLYTLLTLSVAFITTSGFAAAGDMPLFPKEAYVPGTLAPVATHSSKGLYTQCVGRPDLASAIQLPKHLWHTRVNEIIFEEIQAALVGPDTVYIDQVMHAAFESRFAGIDIRNKNAYYQGVLIPIKLREAEIAEAAAAAVARRRAEDEAIRVAAVVEAAVAAEAAGAREAAAMESVVALRAELDRATAALEAMRLENERLAAANALFQRAHDDRAAAEEHAREARARAEAYQAAADVAEAAERVRAVAAHDPRGGRNPTPRRVRYADRAAAAAAEAANEAAGGGAAGEEARPAAGGAGRE